MMDLGGKRGVEVVSRVMEKCVAAGDTSRRKDTSGMGDMHAPLPFSLLVFSPSPYLTVVQESAGYPKLSNTALEISSLATKYL